ncbi:Cdc7p-Dbf4p kinase complex regulatory subunit [Emydomyces testavorans]|uniref:Cdc7p-Dbf4p kinase complex regulatory subunit n=1 Tax=Emydomyces testavorans TaxID=2070801 RepID=A0AAF0DGB9_9EURO|nr:Cdc7p-Dbf4p kinase complex regulatory subunit [Emydomyces testavorans]
MSNRRAPLANVPNATNSPHRGGLLAMKRPRPSNTQADGSLAQPPLKKQILDRDDGDIKSPPRKFVCQTTDSKLFTRKGNAQPSAFERKLVAARDKQSTQSMPKPTKKVGVEPSESVRQWRKHYRKVFPSFVFYFESISEEVRQRWVNQIAYLGAKDERFFSKYITHVVTTRPIPPELESTQSFEATTTTDAHKANSSLHTVNPSLLESGAEVNQLNHGRGRPRSGLDRRTVDADGKKDSSGNVDILYRARQMNMKIWTLDKLQRVISAINDGEVPHTGHSTRNNVIASKSKAESDLSLALRNEKLNGPSDRDSILGTRNLVPFKGPYIYVYDHSGQTRPVMVREYPKVAKKQDGAWSQFRSAALGKCPFIVDPQNKKEDDKDKSQQHNEKKSTAKDKPAISTAVREMAPPPSFEKPALKTSHCDCRRKTAEQVQSTRQTINQAGLPRSNFGPGTAPVPSLGAYSRGEIAASGIQPSNITSAIRSQMISSTAAAPGAKAGTSKEIHELKRKVLEKNNGILSTSQKPSNSITAAGAARVPATRSSKTKTMENLGAIPEDSKVRIIESKTQKAGAVSKRTGSLKRDPKVGYCENCREKFDDFEEHINSRQHRKFALTSSNWEELDELLLSLQREVKYGSDLEDPDSSEFDY